jgi:hypothetical protein
MNSNKLSYLSDVSENIQNQFSKIYSNNNTYNGSNTFNKVNFTNDISSNGVNMNAGKLSYLSDVSENI